jgi:protease-4
MELSAPTRTRIGIAALVVLIAAVALPFALPPTAPEPPGGDVALIPLSGQVVDAAPTFGAGAITPRVVRDRLEAASANPRVGAVILRVNSPGGAPAASQEILDVIADHPDPVVVSMGDQATSGGYYLALGADRIVAQPATLTGSIGVIMTTIDPSELLDDLGVELETITSGEHKDMFIPGRLNEERRAILQRQSDLVYDEFVGAVAEQRELPEDEVRELATGETFTGRQALDAGLVDKVGGLNTAVDLAADLAGLEQPDVVEIRPGVLEQFGGSVGQAVEALGSPDPARQLRSLRDELLAPPELRLQREGEAP